MTGGPIRVVELRGEPFERGVEHGRLLGRLIARYWEELVREVTDRAAETMTGSELRSWSAVTDGGRVLDVEAAGSP